MRREKGVHCTLNIHCNPVGIIEGRGGGTRCASIQRRRSVLVRSDVILVAALTGTRDSSRGETSNEWQPRYPCVSVIVEGKDRCRGPVERDPLTDGRLTTMCAPPRPLPISFSLPLPSIWSFLEKLGCLEKVEKCRRFESVFFFLSYKLIN